jgi:endo-1,4-beta-D-glucanase Y
VDNKLDFLRSVNPALASLRVGVSVMPGTEVALIAKQEGLIKDESELVKPTFYIASEVKEWIVDYLKEQVQSEPRWNLS